MHRAIEQLKVLPEHLLIDGNRFTPYPDIPHTTVVKGDGKYLSIAAASVLAKTYRDDYMNELALEYPAYHWLDNKGYPTKAPGKRFVPVGSRPIIARLLRSYRSSLHSVFNTYIGITLCVYTYEAMPISV